MATSYLKRGDTSPPFTATLKGADGEPADLSGAIARFIMRRAAWPRTVKVDGPMAILLPETDGKVQYDWGPADTNEADSFDGEIEITFGTGEIETFPSRNHHRILIQDDLA